MEICVKKSVCWEAKVVISTRINIISKTQSIPTLQTAGTEENRFHALFFLHASGLPDSGREQGQACQNTTRKDVDDHG